MKNALAPVVGPSIIESSRSPTARREIVDAGGARLSGDASEEGLATKTDPPVSAANGAAPPRAALDATLQTLTPKELAELRLHAALQGSSGPSPLPADRARPSTADEKNVRRVPSDGDAFNAMRCYFFRAAKKNNRRRASAAERYEFTHHKPVSTRARGPLDGALR